MFNWFRSRRQAGVSTSENRRQGKLTQEQLTQAEDSPSGARKYGGKRRSKRQIYWEGIDTTDPDKLQEFKKTVELANKVLSAAAQGQQDPRMNPLPGTDPALMELRSNIDRLLDLSDAYVRESGACVQAMGEHKYYRLFQLRGMPGAFRYHAAQINRTVKVMEESNKALREAKEERSQFARAAVELSAQITSMVSSLDQNASELASTALQAAQVMEQARQTSTKLNDSAEAIDNAVDIIQKIAAQTRLLALNATIEAARAGQAGLGFSIVAEQVKNLAAHTAESSEEIAQQIEQVQTVSEEVQNTVGQISQALEQLDEGVNRIRANTSGQGSLTDLSAQMAAQIQAFEK